MYPHPIVDCHHHVFDPARFPWAEESTYQPAGHELGTPDYYRAVMHAYHIQHSVLVGPTSGYNTDNRCLLDTIKQGAGRFKGIAVVPWKISSEQLADLQCQGVVGVALNVAMLGTEPFLALDSLMAKLAELGLYAQIQVENDQLLALLPLISRTRTQLLIDHSGRPDVTAGIEQPAFKALLALAGQQRTFVKLSGLAKFSQHPFPFEDGWPYLQRLLQEFGAENCLWGSDWPFLRAEQRMDMGTQLMLIEHLIPDAQQRYQVLWETPCRLFGFAQSPTANQESNNNYWSATK